MYFSLDNLPVIRTLYSEAQWVVLHRAFWRNIYVCLFPSYLRITEKKFVFVKQLFISLDMTCSIEKFEIDIITSA